MDLIQSLHDSAVAAARLFKTAESKLVNILEEVERHGVYRKLGYRSMFNYVTESLGLSESYAYALITVTRKATEVPAIKEAVDSGKASVSQLRRIVPVVNTENSDEWINKITTLTQRELDKAIATKRPEKAGKNKMKFINEQRVQLQCAISEELMNKINRAKQIIAGKQHEGTLLEATLDAAITQFLERNDPVKKAERALTQKPVLNPVSKQNSIPATVRHEVMLRDGGQCTAINRKGQRCPERVYLHFHHNVPVSRGGAHTASNIRLTCSACHRMEHEKDRFQFAS